MPGFDAVQPSACAIRAVLLFAEWRVREELKFTTQIWAGTVHGCIRTPACTESLIKTPEELLLTTVRSHDQFNTTIYGEDDRYRGILGGRRVIFMHPDDVTARGLAANDLVDITSHFTTGNSEVQQRHVNKFMVVPYEIPRRCVACYFPEANPLAQISNIADGSRQPVYKSLVVTLAKSPRDGGARLTTA